MKGSEIAGHCHETKTAPFLQGGNDQRHSQSMQGDTGQLHQARGHH
jgi:hypothetical protein